MKKYILAVSATAIVLVLSPIIYPTKSWGNSSGMDIQNNHLLTENQSDRGSILIAHTEEDTLQVPNNKAIPRITLIVHPDARKGWNLELKVSNFKFAPKHVNVGASSTEGHAHLYIPHSAGKIVKMLF